jgi:hypothetical protein
VVTRTGFIHCTCILLYLNFHGTYYTLLITPMCMHVHNIQCLLLGSFRSERNRIAKVCWLICCPTLPFGSACPHAYMYVASDRIISPDEGYSRNVNLIDSLTLFKSFFLPFYVSNPVSPKMTLWLSVQKIP